MSQNDVNISQSISLCMIICCCYVNGLSNKASERKISSRFSLSFHFFFIIVRITLLIAFSALSFAAAGAFLVMFSWVCFGRCVATLWVCVRLNFCCVYIRAMMSSRNCIFPSFWLSWENVPAALAVFHYLSSSSSSECVAREFEPRKRAKTWRNIKYQLFCPDKYLEFDFKARARWWNAIIKPR